MKHITLLACLVILGHRACLGADRPNVLLIIADDCTYRDLGVYGGQAKTPHLDQLAREGVPAPDVLDGRSFLPVLTGAAATHKTHVYGLQTTRGISNGSDHFGIRSVRDARYRYIRNLTPDATFRNVATDDATFKTWQRMAAAGDPYAQRLVHDYQHRPAEELYDCETDPWNRTNLIGEESLAAVREELRGRLDAWMKQQGDEGQATEMRALDRMTGKRINRPPKGSATSPRIRRKST